MWWTENTLFINFQYVGFRDRKNIDGHKMRYIEKALQNENELAINVNNAYEKLHSVISS